MKIKPNIDLYEILEIEKSATPDQIKKQYRNLAKKYHPDKVNQNKTLSKEQKEELIDKMSNISIAYDILSDKKARKEYDLTGKVDDKLSFEAEVDGHLNNIISRSLGDPSVNVSNLVGKCEKMFKADTDKIAIALEKLNAYKKNLEEIVSKKCKAKKKDTKKIKSSKVKLSYIANAQIESANNDIEKMTHMGELTKAASEKLKFIMDDNDERVEQPFFGRINLGGTATGSWQ